jgi:hypothetical protein
MKMTFACTALAAALIGFGSVAMADDAMTAKPAAMPAHTATMVCRAADSTEKATAMMGSKALVCKTIDMKAVMAMKSKMDEPSWQKMLNSLQVGVGAGS